MNSGGDQQSPPLDVFKKICLVLQVDANKLLGLKWVQDDTIELVITDWTLKNDISLHWICPKCNRENITYNNDYKKNKELIFKQGYECEYNDCLNFFDRLKRK